MQPTNPTSPAPGERRGHVLYDGDCRLCVTFAKRLRLTLRSRGFDLVPLQSEWVEEQLHLPASELLTEMRVLTKGGKLRGGAEAIVYLARFVWWAWPFRLLWALPGGKTIMQHGYRWIARNRHCTSRTCPLPRRSSWKNWLPMILLTALAVIVGQNFAPWIVMCMVAAALLAGCKWITWWDAYTVLPDITLRRSLAYLLLWPGMDSRVFLDPKIRPEKPPIREWVFAFAKMLLGISIAWGVARTIPVDKVLLRGWVGMIGGIFVIHFGIFNLLALAWQKAGVQAQPLMHCPIAAHSLGEFWSICWNRGFNDVVRRHVFAPLQPACGVVIAMLLTFLVSGLIHEAVISVPAHGGYGLPTLYFLLQGIGILFERSTVGRKLKLRHGVRGWCFTFILTAGPAYWLFPPVFVERVAVPFLKFIYAL